MNNRSHLSVLFSARLELLGDSVELLDASGQAEIDAGLRFDKSFYILGGEVLVLVDDESVRFALSLNEQQNSRKVLLLDVVALSEIGIVLVAEVLDADLGDEEISRVLRVGRYLAELLVLLAVRKGDIELNDRRLELRDHLRKKKNPKSESLV